MSALPLQRAFRISSGNPPVTGWQWSGTERFAGERSGMLSNRKLFPCERLCVFFKPHAGLPFYGKIWFSPCAFGRGAVLPRIAFCLFQKRYALKKAAGSLLPAADRKKLSPAIVITIRGGASSCPGP